MKLTCLLGWSSALLLSATIAQAQETNNAEKFNKQLQELQDRFDKQQRELRESFEKQQRELRESFEKMNRDQQAQIEALKKQLAVGATNAAPATNTEVADQIKELNEKVDSVVEAQTKTRPNEFNPSIGFVGETIFSYRSKGNDQTGSDRVGGFDVNQRSMELNVAASVDPFAKGYAVINASADSSTGEATMGVEEAALQTTSLPWNLELKAGRFFGEFGRLAYIHDHELPFVNRPLVLDQYIGGESRTDGAQINWLVPVPHYVSLSLGFGDGFGSPPNNTGSYRALSGLNYFGRLSTFFNLTPNWNIETGVSGLINPSTQDRGGILLQPDGSTLTEKKRAVADFDFKLSWLPLQNNQFRSLTWGTEVLYSDSQYLVDPNGLGNPADEFTHYVGSLGLYSYVTYKWHRQWSGGFLFNYVQSAQNNHAQTFSYSPYITYALSHWNQLRLQYTHTDPNAATGFKSDDAIYLQWAWIIGSHAHGWQQR
jgi:hypothetical protein